MIDEALLQIYRTMPGLFRGKSWGTSNPENITKYLPTAHQASIPLFKSLLN